MALRPGGVLGRGEARPAVRDMDTSRSDRGTRALAVFSIFSWIYTFPSTGP